MSQPADKVHDVLIIGLGRIGVGYDLLHDPDEYVLSHARAFQRHPDFRLVGGVDPDAGQRGQFQDQYDCPAFADLRVAIAATNPSVVVVATPTDLHYSTVQAVLAVGKPVAILCEKPISFDPVEAHTLVRLCKDKSCALYVNYMRRSDVGVDEVLQRLQDGRIALPVKGVVWYSKGLFNSASHFVNLLQYLLGDVEKVLVLDKGRRLDGKDPEPDVEIEFVGGKIHFAALRVEDYFHNSMELMAANGRLRYERGGQQITWESTVANPVFSGYTTLGAEPELLRSDFFRIQLNVADQLAASLAGNPSRICSGDEALGTLDVLAQIKDYS